MDTKIIDQVSSDTNEYLDKLHKIVEDTIAEQGLIINKLLHPPKETLTGGDKLSDKHALAAAGNSLFYSGFF